MEKPSLFFMLVQIGLTLTAILTILKMRGDIQVSWLLVLLPAIVLGLLVLTPFIYGMVLAMWEYGKKHGKQQ